MNYKLPAFRNEWTHCVSILDASMVRQIAELINAKERLKKKESGEAKESSPLSASS